MSKPAEKTPTAFRNWVVAEGSSRYIAEVNRYHLYVSYTCPWSSRTLMVHKMKGLERIISVDVVDWMLGEKGWCFNTEVPGCTVDSVHGYTQLRQVYEHVTGGKFEGKVTVPVLYDKKNEEIVNNESSEIMRILNSEFNQFIRVEEQKSIDLYRVHLQKDIDSFNDWILPSINLGVYRTGLAETQDDYNVAVRGLFDALDRVEEILSKQRYLIGQQPTEADVRLFVTLIRFDLVYVLHFKCNRKRIVDYPNIWPYVRDIYQLPGVKETVNFEHIVKGYHLANKKLNPFGIVPINPIIDFDAPHNREGILGWKNEDTE